MELREVSKEAYAGLFSHHPHIFNSVAFSELNAAKCQVLHYLVLADTRIRGGITLGERGDMLASPFSAPYGGLTLPRERHQSQIDEMWSLIVGFCQAKGKRLHVTLPPMWHNESTMSQCVSSLSRLPNSKVTADLSYHLPLNASAHEAGYQARRDLRNAKASGISVAAGNCSADDIARAHKLISLNHSLRGFPMNMTLHDMTATAAMVKADTFFATHNGRDIAAAIVFTVAPGIAQVIVWGDDVEHHNLHPMHLLFDSIADHYRRLGYKALDLGPATEHGVPNMGLCFFKESLGCRASLRFTFDIDTI